jgi:hypothetical protein
MITNNGKIIIGKYLLGQAPAFASYLAVGCGKTPLATGDPNPDYSTQENLDFEMFRVPISSKGFINEDGVDKIVLTAELPTEERYEITEVGVYSAGFNPSAGAYDSKTIFAFTSGENWIYHTSVASSAIEPISTPLDSPEGDNIIATEYPVFQTNADNSIFYTTSRAEKYERCRFLNNVILIAGNDSTIGTSAGHFTVGAGSNHIHLSGKNVDLSKNSPLDELRLAFSIINKDGNDAASVVPDTVRILIDFSSNDEFGSGEYARFEAEVTNTGSQFETNRYYVVSKQLKDLYVSPNFSWNAVSNIKIYACAIDGGSPSADYYIALDAVRLENIATTNPLYGLTGYSVIKNDTEETVIKSPNTSNYIEFRFSIGVS